MQTSPVDCHFKTFIAKSDISCLHKTKLAVASSDKRNPRECEDCYSPLTSSCRLATVNLLRSSLYKHWCKSIFIKVMNIDFCSPALFNV
ncbi:TPA: hypothetical protein HGO57_00210 [Escherichia coli]|nr:hypothetical protein [Escherichia coli]